MEGLLEYGSSSESDGEAHVPDGNPSTVQAAEAQDQKPPSKRPRTEAGNQPASVAAPRLPEARGPPPAGAAVALPSAAAVLDGGGAVEEAPAGPDHQGRVRSFPHVEGNYATHVYITVRVPDHAQAPLHALLQQAKAQLPALEPVREAGTQPAAAGGPGHPTAGSNGLVQPQYHISISRTAPIRFHQIESLVAVLKEYLRKLDTFSICIGEPEVLVNDERTRTFLALSAAATAPGAARGVVRGPLPPPQQHGTSAAAAAAAAGSSPLLRAINAASRAYQLHSLPRFHAEPRPHISVAWLLGDCEAQLLGTLASPALQQASAQLADCRWQVQVDKIHCRAGQKVFVVWEARR